MANQPESYWHSENGELVRLLMPEQRQKKSQLETRRRKHEGNELRLWQSKKEKKTTEENHDQEKTYEEKIKWQHLLRGNKPH
jgi:hypothetical protein